MSALAGALGERVTIERRDPARDALGGAAGEWLTLATRWAAVVPAGSGAAVAGEAIAASPRWRVTLRAGAMVRVGDRLLWRGRRLAVRAATHDPRTRDRLMLDTEEER